MKAQSIQTMMSSTTSTSIKDAAMKKATTDFSQLFQQDFDSQTSLKSEEMNSRSAQSSDVKTTSTDKTAIRSQNAKDDKQVYSEEGKKEVSNDSNKDSSSSKIDTFALLKFGNTSAINSIGRNKKNHGKMEDVMSNLVEFKQVLSNAFSITEDELEKELESMGMNLIDLLQPENLTQFFLQVNGQTDISALLMDDSLSSGLADLMDQINSLEMLQDMLQDMPKEDMADLLDQLNGLLESTEEVQDNVLTDGRKKEDISFNQAEDSTNEINVSSKETKVETKSESNTESNSRDAKSDGKQNDVQGVITNTQTMNTNISDTTKVSFFNQLEQYVDSKMVVQQIIDQVKVNMNQDHTNIEMILKPEHLGRLHMSLTEHGGMMTAKIVTETIVAKEAIESELNILKENFDKQGLKVDAVEVAVGSYNFDAHEQAHQEQDNPNTNKQKTSRIRMDGDLGTDDVVIEQQVEASVVKEIGKGSQIDFSA